MLRQQRRRRERMLSFCRSVVSLYRLISSQESQLIRMRSIVAASCAYIILCRKIRLQFEINDTMRVTGLAPSSPLTFYLWKQKLLPRKPAAISGRQITARYHESLIYRSIYINNALSRASMASHHTRKQTKQRLMPPRAL